MKLNETYLIREFNGTIYAVTVESKDSSAKKPIILNKTARILWETLSEDVTSEDLYNALLDEYDVGKEIVEKDTNAFLDVVRAAGLITE